MDEQTIRQFYDATRCLRQMTDKALRQFSDRTQQESYETDFYGEVKPFADRVQRLLDQWRPLAEAWVGQVKPDHIFPAQIKNTYDNLLIISVTAFQKDTRRRRFYETVKSVDYVLDTILQTISEREKLN